MDRRLRTIRTADRPAPDRRLRVDPKPDPVLLLHGQPGGARDWYRVVDAIAGAATTIAADRPGWDGHRAATDLAGNARAATALLDAHGLQRATIVGHSFGGAVACWLAAHAPERVSALVLAAPSANVASLYRVDRWLAAPLSGPLAAGATLAATGLTLQGRRPRRRLASKLRVQESYLEEAGRALRSRSAWRSFVAEQRVLVSELPALESHLAQIAGPTAIIVGSEDRVIAPRSQRRLAAQIPGARLSVVDGVGHLLPLLAPGRLAELILSAHVWSGLGSKSGCGSGSIGVGGSCGAGTVAGSSGAPGVPGSGTAGVTGASGTTGVAGSAGCGTSSDTRCGEMV